ncbi:hypothetical protein ACFY2Q_27065 [Micromonospora sp. NPDC000316]|uniref:hypothetical protein n=1 Tax=Micromonospora sp. NPDC000316 TaxID=3364216 RepID=UPI003676687D
MAYRTWGKLLLTALGVSVLAGAGQLGVAYGFGIVRLTGAFTGTTVNQWPAQLVWVGWFAANAAVAGAVLTGRLARRDAPAASTGRQLAIGGAAALGATVVAPLCMQPARAAELISVDPVWAVGICAVLGALIGAGAAIAVLLRPELGWNMAAVAGAVWLLALISVLPSLGTTGPLPTVRLGVLEPSWLDDAAAQRLALLLLPIVALLAGAATAGLARWRGQVPLISGATGVAGPVLVAFAYLTAGPGDAVDRYQTTPYYGALIAVLAGALGAAAAALLRWPLGASAADAQAIEPTDILRPLPAGPALPGAAPSASPAGGGDDTEPTSATTSGADLVGAGPGSRADDIAAVRTVPAHWDWPSTTASGQHGPVPSGRAGASAATETALPTGTAGDDSSGTGRAATTEIIGSTGAAWAASVPTVRTGGTRPADDLGGSTAMPTSGTTHSTADGTTTSDPASTATAGTATTGTATTARGGAASAQTGTAGTDTGTAATGTAGTGTAATGTAGTGTAATGTAGTDMTGTATTAHAGTASAHTDTAGTGAAATDMAGTDMAGTATTAHAGAASAHTDTAGTGAASTVAGTSTASPSTADTGTVGTSTADAGKAGTGTEGIGTSTTGTGTGTGTGTTGTGTGTGTSTTGTSTDMTGSGDGPAPKPRRARKPKAAPADGTESPADAAAPFEPTAAAADPASGASTSDAAVQASQSAASGAARPAPGSPEPGVADSATHAGPDVTAAPTAGRARKSARPGKATGGTTRPGAEDDTPARPADESQATPTPGGQDSAAGRKSQRGKAVSGTAAASGTTAQPGATTDSASESAVADAPATEGGAGGPLFGVPTAGDPETDRWTPSPPAWPSTQGFTTSAPGAGTEQSASGTPTAAGDSTEWTPRPRHRAPLPDLSRASSWDAFNTVRRSGPAQAGPVQAGPTQAGSTQAGSTQAGSTADLWTTPTNSTGTPDQTIGIPDRPDEGAAADPGAGQDERPEPRAKGRRWGRGRAEPERTVPEQAGAPDVPVDEPADGDAPSVALTGTDDAEQPSRRGRLGGLFRRNRSRVDEESRPETDATEPLPTQDEEFVDWVAGLSKPVVDNEPEQESGRRSLRSTGRHHRD